VSVALLLIYLAGLIPTVLDQDSGELVSACHVLGIAHPTGYPLWVMLGRLFDFLPVGHTSAYRVAILSAVCAASAAGVLTLLALRLTRQVIPALFAGLAFGLWFPTWSQAVRAEVYGLTALLFAFVLIGALRWSRDRAWPSVYCLSLACGLVAMHHRTAFLAALPPLVTAVALTRPRRVISYLAAGLLFLAPFACYLYLPLRAAAHPPVNWSNPSTLDRFLAHVLGKQYTHFAFSHTLGQMWDQLTKLLPELLSSNIALAVVLAVIGLPLIAWGWWSWYRRERAMACSLAAGAALLVFWVLQWGETTDLKVFLLPLGAVLAICAALGLAPPRWASSDQGGVLVIERQRGHIREVTLVDLGPSRRDPGGKPERRIHPIAAAVLAALLCFLLVWANWSRSDLSNQWGYRDQWAAALMQLEPNAIFVSDFDVPSFATMYLQNVEGLRKDVTVIRTVGVMQPWYVNLIEDDELRTTVVQAWQYVNQSIPITGTGTREFWDGSALFAGLLAEHYRGRRPVYAVHGPTRRVAEPPLFVGLSHDLVELRFEPPARPVIPAATHPMAQFPDTGDLMSCEWEKPEAANGELAKFTTDWHLAEQRSPMQFVIGLIPENMSFAQFAALPAEELQGETRLAQAFPLAYGDLGLPPSPDGMAYRQQGLFIIPSNASPGMHRTAVCVTPLYAQEYGGWTELGAAIRVTARPLPRNGP
jgi:hypothetical protein